MLKVILALPLKIVSILPKLLLLLFIYLNCRDWTIVRHVNRHPGIHPTENLEQIQHEWNQIFRWTDGRAVVPNGFHLKRDGYIPQFQRFSNSRADTSDSPLNVSIPWRKISLVGGECASGPIYL